MDIEHFRNIVVLDIQHSEEKLMNTWYPKVIAMFSGDHSLVNNVPIDTADSFHDCVTTLLGKQMR